MAAVAFTLIQRHSIDPALPETAAALVFPIGMIVAGIVLGILVRKGLALWIIVAYVLSWFLVGVYFTGHLYAGIESGFIVLF